MGHKETDTSVVNIMCKKYDKYINVYIWTEQPANGQEVSY